MMENDNNEFGSEVPPPYVGETPVDLLPPGWESSVDAQGRRFYVDHTTKQTHWSIPNPASTSSNPQPPNSQPPNLQPSNTTMSNNHNTPPTTTTFIYPTSTDRSPLVGSAQVQMGGLGNVKYPLFPNRPSPVPPFTDTCCRCFCPLLSIVGTQGCLDQNDLLFPCLIGCCIPCGDACFTSFMWQPKNALAYGVKVEDTFNFLSCPMKCFCPLYAIAGQQGCVSSKDMWCACLLGCLFTQCCWNPKTRESTPNTLR